MNLTKKQRKEKTNQKRLVALEEIYQSSIMIAALQ